MFTADGELRTPAQATQDPAGNLGVDETDGQSSPVDSNVEREVAEAEPAESPAADKSIGDRPESASTDPSPGFSGPLPEPGFADLVSILAEPIALFLGDVQLPDGRSAENLDLARFHIDLLDVLKQKTESNLSQEESSVLEDLLYRLRMRYVQKSG